MGVSPLPGGLTNVCVVQTLTEPSARRLRPQSIVPATIAADRWLRERFVSARQESPVVALGPLAIDASGSGVPGALLAGDAAGFVDPMTGDGLRFALRGGVLAARAALHELATGHPSFRMLQRLRHQEFARKWRFNRTLRWLAGSPVALDVAAWMTARWSTPLRLSSRKPATFDTAFLLTSMRGPPPYGRSRGYGRRVARHAFGRDCRHRDPGRPRRHAGRTAGVAGE